MTAEHKPGCPATGGYGRGIEPCDCGAVQTQAYALQIADDLWNGRTTSANIILAISELRRLVAENDKLRNERDRFHFALNEWLDKTEWVQQSVKPRELGMHRADILRGRIDQLQAQAQPAREPQPILRVRIASFPESNGKRNWTALLTREGKWDGLRGNCSGLTLAHGECWNRVAYAAQRARFLLGQRDTEPFILDYGDDIETPEQWQGERTHGITAGGANG